MGSRPSGLQQYIYDQRSPPDTGFLPKPAVKLSESEPEAVDPTIDEEASPAATDTVLPIGVETPLPLDDDCSQLTERIFANLRRGS